jgi:hypothetical protein
MAVPIATTRENKTATVRDKPFDGELLGDVT